MNRKNRLFLLCFCLFLTLTIFYVSSCGSENETSQTFIPSRLPKPRNTLYPKSKLPEKKIFEFDIQDVDDHTRIFLTTAQGIVNRDVPKLYLYQSKSSGRKEDLWWLNWLKENAYIEATIPLKSVDEFLETFQTRKVVMVDPDFPASLNIAMMLAGIKGVAVAYPEQVSKYHLEVVEDLKGRWKTNVEAYQWAFDNLWAQMNHTVIACLVPDASLYPLRDYLVAKKIFTFWITGSADGKEPYASPQKEKEAIGNILGKMPVNIPVLGYPWAGEGIGIGEGDGVTLLSRFAKFLVPTDWKANLSLWTGLKPKTKRFRQLPPRDIPYDESKIYVTFLMSDGDNLNSWLDWFLCYWDSPYHGKIPMGWTMGPSITDLQPVLLDYYYNKMKNTDSFGAAVSGIGYIYPEDYAVAYKGDLSSPCSPMGNSGYVFVGDERENIWKEFLELTAKYMKRLDQNWIWIMRYGERKSQNLIDYVEEIPELKGLILDYSGKTPYENANYLVKSVPAFHAINRMDKQYVLQDVLSQIPKERPAFFHIFLHNWSFKYEDVKELVDKLPEDFVVVRPDELSALYKTYLQRKEKK